GHDPRSVGLAPGGVDLFLPVGVRAEPAGKQARRPGRHQRRRDGDRFDRAVEVREMRSPSPPVPQSPSLLIVAVTFLIAAVQVMRAEDPLRLPVGDPARKGRDVPLVLDGITETAGGTVITPAELPARLSGVRLLLVGEEHTA